MKNRKILRKYYAKQSEAKSRKIKHMLKNAEFWGIRTYGPLGYPQSTPCSFLIFDLQFQAK